MPSLVLAAAAGNKYYLVHGCSRGLGLEFVNQLMQRPSAHVFAACRSPSTQILQLQAQQPQRITVVPCDASDEKSIDAAVDRVRDAVPYLNAMINAVGVLHIPGQMMPGVGGERHHVVDVADVHQPMVGCSNTPLPHTETSYSRVTQSHLDACMQANTYAPFLVGKAFYPLLAAAASHQAADEYVCDGISRMVA